MGLCLSADEKEDRQRSHKIDKSIEEDNRRMKRECKILLLGKSYTNSIDNMQWSN
jgi:guanine nucleotide-binding protein G(i) subunit alpha